MEAPLHGIILRDTADKLDLLREQFRMKYLELFERIDLSLPVYVDDDSFSFWPAIFSRAAIFSGGTLLVILFLLLVNYLFPFSSLVPSAPTVQVVVRLSASGGLIANLKDKVPVDYNCIGKIIGSAGGTVFLPDGALLIVPNNSVEKDECFIFNRLAVGKVTDRYLISSTKSEYSKPLTIIIPYKVEKDLRIVLNAESGKSILPHAIHPKTKTAWVDVERL